MTNLLQDEQNVLRAAREYDIVPIHLLQGDNIYRAGPHPIDKSSIDSLQQKGFLASKGRNFIITQTGRDILDLV